MKALLVEELGRAPRLAETSEPVAGPTESMLRVLAAPLNPVDLSIATGGFFAGHPALPYVPGVEAVGVIGATSAATDLVYTCLNGLGTSRHGSCAEFAVASNEHLIPVPSGVEPAVAAAAGTVGLAGWLPLAWRAPVVPGETVVIMGATGNAGLVAVQAAKILGAGQVVAVGRNPRRLELAVRVGADAAVQLQDGDALVDALRAACGDRAPTLVFDPLWGAAILPALEVAAPGARVVQLGQSAGATSAVPSALVRGKHLDILGYTNFKVPFDVLSAGYRRVVDHVSRGEIQLEVERVPLAEGVEAWHRQQLGPERKLVLCP
jgi:NADPH2:quinone reductase